MIYNRISRTLALIILVCGALSSCVREGDTMGYDIININEISFSNNSISVINDGSSSEASTKATDITASNLTDFMVTCHLNSDPWDTIMLRDVVSRDTDGSWTYNNGVTKTIAIGKQGSFYAIAPEAASINISDSEIDPNTQTCSFVYTNPHNTGDQIDLLYASTTSTASEPIDLGFRHAMAGINFKVMGDLSFNISSISLSNVYDQATLVTGSDGSAQWQTHVKTDNSISFEAKILDLGEKPDDYEYTAMQLTDIDNGGIILAIPQTLSSSAQVNVNFEFEDGTTDTKILYLENTLEWEQNTCYTYTIEASTNGTIVMNDKVYISSWDYLIESDIYGSYNRSDYAYINLDDYDASSISALRSVISQYEQAGITRYVVMGTYFDGCFGSIDDFNNYSKEKYGLDLKSEIDPNDIYLLFDDDFMEDLAKVEINSPFADKAPSLEILDLSLVEGLDMFPFMFSGGVELKYWYESYDEDYSFDVDGSKQYKSLNTVILPREINTIPNFTFTFCQTLSTINLDYVEYVKIASFANCLQLKAISMSSMKEIGLASFLMCRSISTITAPLLEKVDPLALASYPSSLSHLYAPNLTVTSADLFYEDMAIFDILNLRYLNLSKAGDFEGFNNYNLEYDGDDNGTLDTLLLNCHLVLNYDKRQGGECTPSASDATIWGGVEWSRISYQNDQGKIIDGEIDLDQYNGSVDALQLAIQSRIDAGIKDFYISGQYFEGCFGTQAGTICTFDSEGNIESRTSDSPFFVDANGKQIKINTFDINNVTGLENDDLFPFIFQQLNYKSADNDSYCKTSYTLPSSITELPDYAFYGNIYLYSVDLLDIKTIGDYAFYGCKELSSLDAPKITSISAHCFDGCASLTEVYTPLVTEVQEYGFANATCLQSFDFDIVTSIGEGAFYRTESLGSVYLPMVKVVPAYAFYKTTSDDYSTNTLRLPIATEIGDYAFYQFNPISVTIPHVTTLGRACFAYSRAITSIEFPSVKTLRDSCLYYCSALMSLNLPSADSLGMLFMAQTQVSDLYLTSENDIVMAETSTEYDMTSSTTYYYIYVYSPFYYSKTYYTISSGETNVYADPDPTSMTLHLHANKSYEYYRLGLHATPYFTSSSSTLWGGTSTWGSILFSDGTSDINSTINISKMTSYTELEAALQTRENMGSTNVSISGMYNADVLGSSLGKDSPFAKLTKISSVNLHNIANLDLPDGVWGQLAGTPFASCLTEISINNYVDGGSLPINLFYFNSTIETFKSNCINDIGNYAFGYCSSLTRLELKTKEKITLGNRCFDNVTTLNCDLVLNIVQKDDTSLYGGNTTWGACTWKSVTFVDNIGNTLEKYTY